jgi:hypothetical protein
MLKLIRNSYSHSVFFWLIVTNSCTYMILLSVCSGIVTNYKDVKMFLLKKGYQFESETDTEVIAKLVHHIFLQNPNCSFRELIEQVIQQLVCIWRIHLHILTASCTEVPISLSINISTRICLLIKLYSLLFSVFWQVTIWYLWPLYVSFLSWSLHLIIDLPCGYLLDIVFEVFCMWHMSIPL